MWPSVRYAAARLTRAPGLPVIAIVYLATMVAIALAAVGFLPYPHGIEAGADIRFYWIWSDVLSSGHYPVNDPYWQYPPLAIFVFKVGQLMSTDLLLGYLLLMFLISTVIFGILIKRGIDIRDELRAKGEPYSNQGLAGAWYYTLCCLACGPILLTRFDLVPTLFAVIGLVFLTKPVRAGVAFGIGALLKIWPGFLILALPRRQFGRGLAAMIVTGVVGMTFALLYAPFGLSFLEGQSNRGLQLESLGATGYLISSWLGNDIVTGVRYGSHEILMAGASEIATIVTVIGFVIVAVIGWARLRGRLDPVPTADVALAIVLALITFSRVLSPQFMVWAFGIGAVCLLDQRTRMRPVLGLILAATAIGQLIFPLFYDELHDGAFVGVFLDVLRVALLLWATGWALKRIFARDLEAGQSRTTQAKNPVRAVAENVTDLITARLAVSRLRSDRGAVAITAFFIFIPIGMGSAAIGIDVSNWYYLGQRLQVAADAAALAGTVYMPGDLTTATNAARAVSKANGFEHNPGASDPAKKVTVAVAAGTKSSELRVTVTAGTKNFFGWALGSNMQGISRTAVAEYRGPVPMGSPCNLFGNEPSGGTSAWSTATPGTSCSRTPDFWANAAGPGALKTNGDRYLSRTCTNGDSGCSGTTNSEYNPVGHFFKMTVKEPVSSVAVEIFDPALVHVGNQCDTNLPSTWSYNQPNPYSTITGDAAQRYRRGVSNDYCTGDNMFGGQATTAVTTFSVRAPSATAENPLAGQVLTNCTRQFRGYGNSLNFTTLLRQSQSGYNAELASLFRQWVQLCTINNPTVGDYYVQVRTNLPFGTSNAAALNSTTEYPSVNWNGHNRYSLRAKVSGTISNVTLAGYGEMSIYANSDAADTNFFLSRVNAASAGMSMDINLYDAGDADTAGTITVVPPADATVDGQPLALTNCAAMGSVRGSMSNGQSLTNCQLTNVSSASGFQGKSQIIRVAIPVGYSCDESSQYGCWFKIRFQYPGGTHDATTWSTDLIGQPVRLVE